ncbi:hypothetical protein SAMN05661010_02728 [Modicisalibacter muralis]|uniref:Pilus biogenesis CpaD protein (Pilus_cpaD) n=1 Tax=Modicisalibacter muralis TaxID=119000 RepID=A0A1G9NIE0_9GAMM|nr:hypothetical protein [Halomonas muralis]SDL86342.1 hypothetical protein SAMN05661010_02728 [Halomonas muralis]
MKQHLDKPLWRLLPLLALLTGCQSALGPMSWETGYRQVGAVGGPLPGSEGMQRQLIVPNTCQAEPDQSGIIELPPGCANDLNLQLMVEHPGDLLHGQEMGPARAGPVARAAHEQLNGRKRANERRRRLEEEASGSMSGYATTGDL